MATGELPLQTSSPIVTIEYPSDHRQKLYLIKAKKGLLAKYLIEEKRSVLFFGEGNFTFSVAFAAMRKSRSTICCFADHDPWKGILSTCYWQRLELPLPHFDSVKVECIKNSLIWHDKATAYLDKELEKKLEDLRLCSDFAISGYRTLTHMDSQLSSDFAISGYRELMHKIKVLSEIPDPGHHWESGHDALKPFDPHNVIWFQCPWTSPDGVPVDKLVYRFMLNTANHTRGGQLVCLGITKHVNYVKRYHLETILGEKLRGTPNSTPILEYFTFLGADTELIADILSFGYRHHSDSGRDIHNYILPHHVTLVFQRKEEEESQM